MIEVFFTDIQNKVQTDRILSKIQTENNDFKINFGLNETDFPFRGGHTILRVEDNKTNSDKILEIVKRDGFSCEIPEDKICIQKEKL
jgi:hypothetical protein